MKRELAEETAIMSQKHRFREVFHLKGVIVRWTDPMEQGTIESSQYEIKGN